MNEVERFAGAVWERHCPDQDRPPIWVERLLQPQRSLEKTRFQRVEFAGADRFRPRDPQWSAITYEQVGHLVGAPVATGRGAGYVPRAAKSEVRWAFEEFAVARLAPSRPFREPTCMPAGVPWWRRQLRQMRPRHDARSCCWYHGGGWHRVNAMAIEVLRRARAQGVDPDGMEGFATAHAVASGVTRWDTEALATLFSIANAIQPSSGTGYINGRHRTQAMLEAGIRRTVVLHLVDEPWPSRRRLPPVPPLCPGTHPVVPRRPGAHLAGLGPCGAPSSPS
ncbi:hypothetical protein ACWEOA_29055 [Streptomyces sp. NPDC004457]